jgi:hypothetical protein
MLKNFKRASRAGAAALIAVTFVFPAAVAMAGTVVDGGHGIWSYGTQPYSGVTQRLVWSQLSHDSKRHKTTAYGDIDGYQYSGCKAPNVLAYADAVYKQYGENHAYYDYPC